MLVSTNVPAPSQLADHVRTTLGVAIGEYDKVLEMFRSGSGNTADMGHRLVVAGMNTGAAQDSFEQLFPGSELSVLLRRDSSIAPMNGGFIQGMDDTPQVRRAVEGTVTGSINAFRSHALDAVNALKNAQKA